MTHAELMFGIVKSHKSEGIITGEAIREGIALYIGDPQRALRKLQAKGSIRGVWESGAKKGVSYKRWFINEAHFENLEKEKNKEANKKGLLF